MAAGSKMIKTVSNFGLLEDEDVGIYAFAKRWWRSTSISHADSAAQQSCGKCIET